MKDGNLKRYGLVLLFFIVLAAFLFRCGWGDDRVFNGSDCNIGLVANAHRQLPDLFHGAYSATPLFGTATSVPCSLFNIGRWLLPPEMFCDSWYGFYLVVSSFFFVAYLRLFKLRWVSCVFGAVAAFWVGSVTLSAAGHINKLGVMMFFVMTLYFVEKSVCTTTRSSRIFLSSSAGLAVGFMLLEQQDVALFAGLFLGAYLLFRLLQVHVRKPVIWIEHLVPVALIGLFLAGPTALSAYRHNVTEVGMEQGSSAKWEFITQWSMVPAELPDLIAPGYTGWSTGNQEGPYWGKIGRSAGWETAREGYQNLRLDSLYLGIVPLWLAVFGVGASFFVRKREKELSSVIFFWACLGLVALFLSFGKYFPAYKLFYHLPLLGNIRAPIKFLHNFQVMNAILAAYGLDQLIKREWKWKRLAVSLLTLAGLFCLLAFSVDSASFTDWGGYAKVIVHTTRAAWLHAAVLAFLLGACVFFRWKKTLPFFQTGCACFAVGLVVCDSFLLTEHYFKSENIAQLKQGNAVVNYLKQNQGNERVLFLDSSGIYNRWLGVEAPYDGINVFNVWQMPRMSQDYRDFLTVAGRNQVRLWQLASVKYITAPASVFSKLKDPLKGQLAPVMFYCFIRQGNGVGVQTLPVASGSQDQVLLEFNNSLPRISLFYNWESLPKSEHLEKLFAPEFDPFQTVLVDREADLPQTQTAGKVVGIRAEMTAKDTVAHVDADQDGVLLFTQYFQPGWSVFVDGVPTEPLVCNYLNLGVFLGKGQHTILFSYDP